MQESSQDQNQSPAASGATASEIANLALNHDATGYYGERHEPSESLLNQQAIDNYRRTSRDAKKKHRRHTGMFTDRP